MGYSDTVAQGIPRMTRLAMSLLAFTAQVHRGQQSLFNNSSSVPCGGEGSVRVPGTEGTVFSTGLIAATPAAIPVVSALRAGLCLFQSSNHMCG